MANRPHLTLEFGGADGDTDSEQGFHLFEDEDSDSINTKKQIKYALSVFDQFCTQNNCGDYMNKDNASLDKTLSKFYISARSRDGKFYSKNTMQAIRFGLQRHFQINFGIDIIKNSDFSTSNKAFKALIVKMKAEGKASVNHHPPISENDMAAIQTYLNDQKNTSKGLQRQVFMDVMIHFANRGMDNLREMKREDFMYHAASLSGREYFTIRDMQNKNHPDDERESQGGRMYGIANHPSCPVANLKRYLSKLNQECQWMWQRPKQLVNESLGVWYDNVPLGRDTLSGMIKKISEEANCSRKYTNHSLRATAITILDHAGVTSGDNRTVSQAPERICDRGFRQPCTGAKATGTDRSMYKPLCNVDNLEEDEGQHKNIYLVADKHPEELSKTELNEESKPKLQVFIKEELDENPASCPEYTALVPEWPSAMPVKSEPTPSDEDLNFQNADVEADIDAIVDNDGWINDDSPPPTSNRGRDIHPEHRLHNVGDHIPERAPHASTNNRCVVCSEKYRRAKAAWPQRSESALPKRRKTVHWCTYCKVFLCIGLPGSNCWRSWHKMVAYWE